MNTETSLSLSPTGLKAYLDCPRSFYLRRQPEIPKKTDLPRFCGSQIHNHVGQLYRPVKDEREFYFKNKESALGAWHSRWQRNLKKEIDKNELLDYDEDKAKMFCNIGADCIRKYWEANTGKTPPSAVEKRLTYNISSGVKLLGILDQIRQPSLEWIARHRPELVVNGELNQDYDPAVIVDMKSDYLSYDAKSLKENPSTSDWIKKQYKLHEDIQATVYSFLYEKTQGKKPLGFVWYHLRSGMGYFTFREEKDYGNLNNIVEHVVGNINAQSFPKHVGQGCQRCDYMQFCREDRPFFIAVPEPIMTGTEANISVRAKIEVGYTQKRMNLVVERRKTEKLPVVVKTKPGEFVLKNLPWRKSDEMPKTEEKPADKIICYDCLLEMGWDKGLKRFTCPVHG